MCEQENEQQEEKKEFCAYLFYFSVQAKQTFREKYGGEQEDNQAIKNMSYMEKKMLLV